MLIFLISRCSQNSSQKEDVYQDKSERVFIDLMDVDEEIIEAPSEIMTVMEYIPLQTTNGVVIGEINELVANNGIYFIKDDLANCIYTFDKYGNHNSTISSIGKGIGEYVKIDAFTINRQNNDIIIFDNRQRKILFYAQNGTFINEKKINASIEGLAKSKRGIYLNTEFLWNKDFFKSYPRQYQLVYIEDNDDDMISSFEYNHNNDLCSFPRISNKFSSINDSLLYIDDVGNSIYNLLEDGSISKRYRIDFGKMTMPFEYSEIKNPEDINQLNKLLNDGKLAVLRNFMETTKHICLEYAYSTLRWTFFYSKTTKNKVNIPMIINDSDGIQIASPISATDSTFISAIDAYEFINAYKRSPLHKSDRVTELYKKLKNTDNPVLAIIKIKENF